MSQLCAEIRTAIEAETKIYHELVLSGDAFVVNDGVVTSEPPKPKPRPPVPEKESPTSFTLAQVRGLALQLKEVSQHNILNGCN